jgi:hypothetical protein
LSQLHFVVLLFYLTHNFYRENIIIFVYNKDNIILLNGSQIVHFLFCFL